MEYNYNCHTVYIQFNESIKFDQTALILGLETHWVYVFAILNERH